MNFLLLFAGGDDHHLKSPFPLPSNGTFLESYLFSGWIISCHRDLEAICMFGKKTKRLVTETHANPWGPTGCGASVCFQLILETFLFIIVPFSRFMQFGEFYVQRLSLFEITIELLGQQYWDRYK